MFMRFNLKPVKMNRVPSTLLLRYSLRNTSDMVRWYSNKQSPNKRPTFISRLYDNFRDEMSKNKEMKESLRKFREEAEKLEQSDALKAARQKFESVEKEAGKGGEALRAHLDQMKERVQNVIDEAGKTELAKKAGKLGEEISKTTSTISEKAQEIGKTQAFQKVSEATKNIRKEMDTISYYISPKKLRKRDEVGSAALKKDYEPNTEATGIEVHRDSQMYESWAKVKASIQQDPYYKKLMDLRSQYEESTNPVVRSARFVSDKVYDVYRGIFTTTPLSDALTEICKIDPDFDTKKFLCQCEFDFVPNILEAIVRGDLDVLRTWCFEAPYNIIAQQVQEARKRGCVIDSKVLDIDNIDLVVGKMVDQGPVLVISFQAQQVMCFRDKNDKVVQGDPDKVLRYNYIWVLCRDPNEMNPNAAWRLMEMTASSAEQFL